MDVFIQLQGVGDAFNKDIKEGEARGACEMRVRIA